MEFKARFCLGSGATLGLLAVILSGCAAPQAPASLATTAPNSLLNGRIAAIRPVRIAAQDDARAGLNAVLDALNQQAATGPITATEIVFLKNDGNAASFAQPGSADSLTPGEPVAVITGDSTSLLPAN